VLRENGRVACWGANGVGQLGDGGSNNQPFPVPVVGLSRVAQLAVGSSHSCAPRDNGRVFCWGLNRFGALGDGGSGTRRVPVRVRDLTGVVQVAVGSGADGHSCAVRDTGRVFCWGYNWAGQLGDGTTESRLVPVRVLVVTNAAGVATGGNHSCAFRPNGRAWCWGYNLFGQLGDGTTTNRATPVPVAP
jgi:alpha-tubulin suppressor-like RCC1 family protein